MCGKIGGGPTPWDEVANAAMSEWYAACTSGGQTTYPYGNKYAGDACNGEDFGSGTTVPVASMGACQSSVLGYGGVYDLSGNVLEWENSCNGDVGGFDWCQLRGGAYQYSGYDLRCDVERFTPRSFQGEYMGMRCCSSP